MSPFRERDPQAQTGAWIGANETHKYVIRLYADGTMTAEVKDLATGLYAGEVVVAPEAGWWTGTPTLSVVS